MTESQTWRAGPRRNRERCDGKNQAQAADVERWHPDRLTDAGNLGRVDPVRIAAEAGSKDAGPYELSQALGLDAEGVDVMRPLAGGPRRRLGELEDRQQLRGSQSRRQSP